MKYNSKYLTNILKHSHIGIGLGISLYGISQFVFPYEPLLNKIEEVRIESRKGLESIINKKLPDSESSHNKDPYMIFDLGVIIALAPEVLAKEKKHK